MRMKRQEDSKMEDWTLYMTNLDLFSQKLECREATTGFICPVCDRLNNQLKWDYQAEDKLMEV
jgi:hypothetical protein